jgi:uncharacterized peroxidase-related enzyme
VKAHAAVAAYLLANEELVAAVLRDVETAPLSDAEKALLRFIEKVNADSPSIQLGDIEELHAHGWTDEAIYDAITVCAMFNFYNRWIDATGVHAMSDEAHKAAASRMAAGYVRTLPADR